MRNLILKIRGRSRPEDAKKEEKEAEQERPLTPRSLSSRRIHTKTEKPRFSSSSSVSSIVTQSTTTTTSSVPANVEIYPDVDTPQKATVRELLDVINKHDVEFQQFFHMGMKFWFGDKMALDVPAFFDVLCHLFQSFPDFSLRLISMQQISENTVRLMVTAHGTHTGVPYRTPQFTTLLPTSGVPVANDPEEWTIIFSGRRIKENRIRPLGKYSGPNGFYMRILEALAAQEGK